MWSRIKRGRSKDIKKGGEREKGPRVDARGNDLLFRLAQISLNDPKRLTCGLSKLRIEAKENQDCENEVRKSRRQRIRNRINGRGEGRSRTRQPKEQEQRQRREKEQHNIEETPFQED